MNLNLFLKRNKIRIRGNKIRNNYKYNNTKTNIKQSKVAVRKNQYNPKKVFSKNSKVYPVALLMLRRTLN